MSVYYSHGDSTADAVENEFPRSEWERSESDAADAELLGLVLYDRLAEQYPNKFRDRDGWAVAIDCTAIELSLDMFRVRRSAADAALALIEDYPAALVWVQNIVIQNIATQDIDNEDLEELAVWPASSGLSR
jgi:hypothetical protein